MLWALQTALVLLGCRRSHAEASGLMESVQNKIAEMFSAFAGRTAPVLLNLNCELENDFLGNLVASQLTLSTWEAIYYIRDVDLAAEYSKVFSTNGGVDRFYLGLHCSLKIPKNDGASYPYIFPQSMKISGLFPNVRVPSHSFAFLWITDYISFTIPGNRILASFTQIYASYDNSTNELVFRTTQSAIDKWYDPFLGIHLQKLESLQRFELGELKFGRSSTRNFRLKKLSATHWSAGLHLYHPALSNVSVFVTVGNQAAEITQIYGSSFLITTYRSLEAVAVVPSTSKSKQVVFSLLRGPIWLAILTSAMVATLVLKLVEQRSVPTFIKLVMSVIFPVKFNLGFAPKQFFIIVGTWIFILQVVRFGFIGDIVASMQKLPEDRIKRVAECMPFVEFLNDDRDTSNAYVDTHFLPLFFFYELGDFLRGSVICRDVEGFGMMREALLKNVPIYKMDLEQDIVPKSLLSGLYFRFLLPIDHPVLRHDMFKELLALDPGRLCCSRLAQLGLSHSLFERRDGLAPRIPQARYDEANFRSSLDAALNRKLSPKYFTKICLKMIWANNQFHAEWLVQESFTREMRRQCFLLDDLRARAEHAMLMYDLIPILQICALPLLGGVACFLVEAVRRILTERRKIRNNLVSCMQALCGGSREILWARRGLVHGAREQRMLRTRQAMVNDTIY